MDLATGDTMAFLISWGYFRTQRIIIFLPINEHHCCLDKSISATANRTDE
jgi:hypothetical protein